MRTFTPEELRMLCHAMKIGLEDGSLCGESLTKIKRAEALSDKLKAMLRK